MSETKNSARSGAPRIVSMRVVPVAGRDSMLLNLSGAHGPYFTRNLVILEDSTGRFGLGEVPGGEKIRKTLEDAIPLVLGSNIGAYNDTLGKMKTAFADRDSGGRVSRLSISAPWSTPSRRWSRLLDLLGKFLELPVASLLGTGRQRAESRCSVTFSLSATGARPTCLRFRVRCLVRLVPPAE